MKKLFTSLLSLLIAVQFAVPALAVGAPAQYNEPEAVAGDGLEPQTVTALTKTSSDEGSLVAGVAGSLTYTFSYTDEGTAGALSAWWIGSDGQTQIAGPLGLTLEITAHDPDAKTLAIQVAGTTTTAGTYDFAIFEDSTKVSETVSVTVDEPVPTAPSFTAGTNLSYDKLHGTGAENTLLAGTFSLGYDNLAATGIEKIVNNTAPETALTEDTDYTVDTDSNRILFMPGYLFALVEGIQEFALTFNDAERTSVTFEIEVKDTADASAKEILAHVRTALAAEGAAVEMAEAQNFDDVQAAVRDAMRKIVAAADSGALDDYSLGYTFYDDAYTLPESETVNGAVTFLLVVSRQNNSGYAENTFEDVPLKLLPPIAPSVEDGEYTYTKGYDGDVTIPFDLGSRTSKANTITQIEIGADSKTAVGDSNYNINYESNTIVMNASYLYMLAEGEHTFTVTFDNGVTSTFVVAVGADPGANSGAKSVLANVRSILKAEDAVAEVLESDLSAAQAGIKLAVQSALVITDPNALSQYSFDYSFGDYLLPSSEAINGWINFTLTATHNFASGDIADETYEGVPLKLLPPTAPSVREGEYTFDKENGDDYDYDVVVSFDLGSRDAKASAITQIDIGDTTKNPVYVSNYDIDYNAKTITLKAGYLAELEVGEHTFTVHFDDFATTPDTFTVTVVHNSPPGVINGWRDYEKDSGQEITIYVDLGKGNAAAEEIVRIARVIGDDEEDEDYEEITLEEGEEKDYTVGPYPQNPSIKAITLKKAYLETLSTAGQYTFLVSFDTEDYDLFYVNLKTDFKPYITVPAASQRRWATQTADVLVFSKAIYAKDDTTGIFLPASYGGGSSAATGLKVERKTGSTTFKEVPAEDYTLTDGIFEIKGSYLNASGLKPGVHEFKVTFTANTGTAGKPVIVEKAVVYFFVMVVNGWKPASTNVDLAVVSDGKVVLPAVPPTVDHLLTYLNSGLLNGDYSWAGILEVLDAGGSVLSSKATVDPKGSVRVKFFDGTDWHIDAAYPFSQFANAPIFALEGASDDGLIRISQADRLSFGRTIGILAPNKTEPLKLSIPTGQTMAFVAGSAKNCTVTGEEGQSLTITPSSSVATSGGTAKFSVTVSQANREPLTYAATITIPKAATITVQSPVGLYAEGVQSTVTYPIKTTNIAAGTTLTAVELDDNGEPITAEGEKSLSFDAIEPVGADGTSRLVVTLPNGKATKNAAYTFVVQVGDFSSEKVIAKVEYVPVTGATVSVTGADVAPYGVANHIINNGADNCTVVLGVSAFPANASGLVPEVIGTGKVAYETTISDPSIAEVNIGSENTAAPQLTFKKAGEVTVTIKMGKVGADTAEYTHIFTLRASKEQLPHYNAVTIVQAGGDAVNPAMAVDAKQSFAPAIDNNEDGWHAVFEPKYTLAYDATHLPGAAAIVGNTLTARGAGKAKVALSWMDITGRTTTGGALTDSITISGTATGAVFTEPAITLLTGAAIDLNEISKLVLKPVDTAEFIKIDWSTDKDTVIKVAPAEGNAKDINPQIKALAAGTAKLTATVTPAEGATPFTATLAFTVVQGVENIKVSAPAKYDGWLDVGGTVKLAAAVNENPKVAAPKDKTVFWVSDNPAIATVDSAGLVGGVSAGTAVIKATARDSGKVFDAFSVTVVDPIVTLTLDAPALTVAAGKTVELAATPAFAPGKTPDSPDYTDGVNVLNWTTNSSAKATFASGDTATGLGVTIKGVAAGTSTITVTNPHTGLKAAVVVTVVAEDALFTGVITAVTVTPNTIALDTTGTKTAQLELVADGVKLTGDGKADNAGKYMTKFETDDPKVATVDKAGKVTAVGSGSTTITAGVYDYTKDTWKTNTVAVQVSKPLSGITLKDPVSGKRITRLTMSNLSIEASHLLTDLITFNATDSDAAVGAKVFTEDAFLTGTTLVTAKSDDDTVVTFDAATGRLVYVGTGITTVTVSVTEFGASREAKTAKLTVTGKRYATGTNDPATGIAFSGVTRIAVEVGKTIKLAPVFAAAVTEKKLDAASWSSSNPNAATVSKGTVKGLVADMNKPITISVEALGGLATATVDIFVVPAKTLPVIKGITIDQKNFTVAPGGTFNLTAAFKAGTDDTLMGNTDAFIQWFVTNTKGANARVEALSNPSDPAYVPGRSNATLTLGSAEGTVTVTAYEPFTGKSAKITVTIANGYTAPTLSPKNWSTEAQQTLPLGVAKQLSVNYNPGSTKNKNVVWSVKGVGRYSYSEYYDLDDYIRVDATGKATVMTPWFYVDELNYFAVVATPLGGTPAQAAEFKIAAAQQVAASIELLNNLDPANGPVRMTDNNGLYLSRSYSYGAVDSRYADASDKEDYWNYAVSSENITISMDAKGKSLLNMSVDSYQGSVYGCFLTRKNTKSGIATITFTSKTNKKLKTSVKIYVGDAANVADSDFDTIGFTQNPYINLGKTLKLNPVILDELENVKNVAVKDFSYEIIGWKDKGSAACPITLSGNTVKAVTANSWAQIEATDGASGLTDTFTVYTVAPVSKVAIQSGAFTMPAGTIVLEAVTTSGNPLNIEGTNSLTWTSSAPANLKVVSSWTDPADGNRHYVEVEALAPTASKAPVTLTAANGYLPSKKHTVKVTIVAAGDENYKPVENLSLSTAYAAVNLGKTVTLKATPAAADGGKPTNGTVVWKITESYGADGKPTASLSAIATVSSTGAVKGVAPGRVVVTAYAAGSPELVETCVVDVVNPVKSIAVSWEGMPKNKVLVLDVGDSSDDKVRIAYTPWNATDKSLTITSSNPAAATAEAVDFEDPNDPDNGYKQAIRVNANGSGTAVITVKPSAGKAITFTVQANAVP